MLIKVHILPRRQLFKLNTNFKHHSHPGIYSIKLYGSVNYRFEVTAKFCRNLPNFQNLRPFCQKLQIKTFMGQAPLVAIIFIHIFCSYSIASASSGQLVLNMQSLNINGKLSGPRSQYYHLLQFGLLTV